MTAMQNLPYNIKVRRAEIRAHEFISTLDGMGLEAHVSVGGLDSITLLYFLRSIGINVPAISVSSLEDKSIQKIHKEIGVISLSPGKSKTQILNEFGFPVISKRIAGKIETLQHPTAVSYTHPDPRIPNLLHRLLTKYSPSAPLLYSCFPHSLLHHSCY